MMFKCPRCGYTSNRKGNLKNHFMKKKTCDAINSDISVSVLVQRISQMNAFKVDLHEEKRDFSCPHCKRLYSRNSHVNRHVKTCRFASNPPGNIIQNNIGSVNNIMINTNINNITINSYGSENLEYLTDKLIIEISKNTTIPMAIQKLISEIHFNKKHPENCNLKLKSERSKYAEIFQNKWQKIPKNELITSLIHEKATMIDDAFEENDVPKSTIHKRFDKNYYNKSGRFHRDLEKNTECLLINLSAQ